MRELRKFLVLFVVFLLVFSLPLVGSSSISEEELNLLLNKWESSLMIAKEELIQSQNSLLQSQLELKNVKLELIEAQNTLLKQTEELNQQSQRLMTLSSQSKQLGEDFRTLTKTNEKLEFKVRVLKTSTYIGVGVSIGLLVYALLK